MDWVRLQALGLAKLVEQQGAASAARASPTPTSPTPSPPPSPGAAECTTDVKGDLEGLQQVLRSSDATLDALFTFYAATGGDPSHLSLNQWNQCLATFDLVNKASKHCKRADMDRLFIAVDAAASRVALQTKEDDSLKAAARPTRMGGAKKQGERLIERKKKVLNRVEFTLAVVQMAINRYVLAGEVAYVSEACRRLLELDIKARVDPRVLAVPDFFRRRA